MRLYQAEHSWPLYNYIINNAKIYLHINMQRFPLDIYLVVNFKSLNCYMLFVAESLKQLTAEKRLIGMVYLMNNVHPV